jgi:hypothetical protein
VNCKLPWIIADNQGGEALELGAGQAWRPSGDGAGLEGLQPALAVLGQPAIDRGPGHAQPSGDVLGMGALFDLADGPDAQLLQGLVVEFAAVVIAHTRTRPDHHHQVNLLVNGSVTC